MKGRDETPIFGALAARYYAAGLPVIPLHYHDKRPVLNDWSRYHVEMPNAEQQQQWAETFYNYNIGLVLGEQSGICIIDIDSDDKKVQQIIYDCLNNAGGMSPWRRVGRKGCQLAYKYNGQPTFRIKDVAGNSLVEFLSSRTQTVLPPSIHPDTQRPYEANCDLVDVLGDLPVLNSQFESLLRGAFKAEGIELSISGWTKTTDWTPAGARDVQMTSVAGHYAYGVLRGEISVVEAIERLKGWYSASVEKVAGDDVNLEKGIQNIIRFIVRDVTEKEKILPKGWDEGLDDESKEAMGLKFDEDYEEWDFEEIKSHLKSQFERHGPGTQACYTAVEQVLKRCARTTNLTSIDEERLFRYIVDVAGLGVTTGTLKKRVRELAQGELKGTDHTEIARAVIKEIEQYTPIRFEKDMFWQWNGSHWIEYPKQDLMRTIAEQYGHLLAARKNSDHLGVLKTMANLVSQGIREVDVRGVNFANGVLMTNGELKQHDPAYGMTYTLPFRYVPEDSGKAWRFFEFLERAWGKTPDYEQRTKALQEAICITIFGLAPSYQRAFLLYGAPQSGKSQMLQIVSSLVPHEARSNCSPEGWNDKFSPTTMLNTVINVCGELSDDKNIDGQRFKSIIDGEEIEGQYKGGQIFRFRPICAHWFASNHLPRTKDKSSAFNRRWLIFEFNSPVKSSEVKLDYGQSIVAEEREAIAAWAIEALPRLNANSRITVPPSHVDVIDEVAIMNNSVRYFIKESGKVEVQPGSRTSHLTSEKILHEEYYTWCLGAGGAQPVMPRAFKAVMKELGIEMGFERITSDTDGKTLEPSYAGITLVKKGAR